MRTGKVKWPHSYGTTSRPRGVTCTGAALKPVPTPITSREARMRSVAGRAMIARI